MSSILKGAWNLAKKHKVLTAGIATAAAAPFAYHGANKLYNKAQDYVGNKIQTEALKIAETASRRTANEIRKQVRNQGPMATTYQLFNPDGYSRKFREQTDKGINDTLSAQRALSYKDFLKQNAPEMAGYFR